MSDTSTQEEIEPQEGDPNIKQLREKAKKFDEAEAQLQAANRKVAILESGLDVESPLGQLFVKGYDGDFTAEALKEEAAKYGVPLKGQVVETPPEGEGAEETTEPTGTTERRALSDGAPADTGLDEDPRKTAQDLFDRRMSEGAPEEDAQADALRSLAAAANRGDKRVIYDPAAVQRERALAELGEL